MKYVRDTLRLEAEDEYWFIVGMVDDIIDEQKELNNNVPAVLAKGLSKLISKIPDEKSIKKIIADLPKAINKINPQNLEIIKSLGKTN